MIIEACILIFFLCRFIHNVLFAESASFWKDPKNIVVIVTIIVSTKHLKAMLVKSAWAGFFWYNID